MRNEVRQLLKKAIFDGIYEPGEQIFEAELAKKLQLSRGPIREALLQLERESLVQHVHNKGWFVIQLAPEDRSEITSLRAVLELLALKLARESVTPHQINALRKILKKMVDAFEAGKFAEASQADFEFHQKIWNMSGHHNLGEVLVKITTPFFAYYKMPKAGDYKEISETRRRLEADHQLVIAYLAGETDKTAESCIRNLFGSTNFENWSRLLDLIQEK
jgi:DNA-binding GntR family transcriptional regulator